MQREIRVGDKVRCTGTAMDYGVLTVREIVGDNFFMHEGVVAGRNMVVLVEPGDAEAK